MNRRLFFGLLGVLGAGVIPKIASAMNVLVKGRVRFMGRAKRAGFQIPRPSDAMHLSWETDVYKKKTTYKKTWIDTKAAIVSKEHEPRSLSKSPHWMRRITHLGPRFNGHKYSVSYYRHVIRWVKVHD